MTDESKFENLEQAFRASKRPRLEVTIPRTVVRVMAVLDEYEGDQSVLWTAQYLGDLLGAEVMKVLIYDPRGLFLAAKDSYEEFLALIKEQRRIYEHYREFTEVEMIVDPRVATFFDKISELYSPHPKKEDEKEEKAPLEAEIFGGDPTQELSSTSKEEMMLSPEMFQDLVNLLLSPLDEGKGVMDQLMSIMSWFDPDLIVFSPPLTEFRDMDSSNPLGEFAQNLITKLPRDVLTLMVTNPLANLVKNATCFLYSPQKDDSIVSLLSATLTFLVNEATVEIVDIIDQQALDAASMLAEEKAPEDVLQELIKKQEARLEMVKINTPFKDVSVRRTVKVGEMARIVKQIAEEKPPQLLVFSPRITGAKSLDQVIAEGIKEGLRQDIPILVVW